MRASAREPSPFDFKLCVHSSSSHFEINILFLLFCICIYVTFRNAGRFALTTTTCVHIVRIAGPITVDRYRLRNYDLHFKSHWNDTVFFSLFCLALFRFYKWPLEPRLNYKNYIYFFRHTVDPYPHLQLVEVWGILEQRVRTFGHRRVRERARARQHNTSSGMEALIQKHQFRTTHTLYSEHSSSSSQCAIKFNWRGMHSPSDSETVIHLCHNAIKS